MNVDEKGYDLSYSGRMTRPVYSPSLVDLIRDNPVKIPAKPFHQHTATPERKQQRRDMKTFSKCQYKKLTFAIKVRQLAKEGRNTPDYLAARLHAAARLDSLNQQVRETV